MPKPNYTFEAIGTHWSIETPAPLTSKQKADIMSIADVFDQAYSRFRNDSLVRQLQTHGSATFPANITAIYAIYRKLAQATNGKVNPLVGHSLEQLGYDSTYSLHAEQPVPAPDFATLTLESSSVKLSQPALLDIGAVGKGYLVDEIAAYVANITPDYTVDGGGDIAVHTAVPESIGLEHPLDTTRIIGVVKLAHGSLCGSATNRRAWGSGLHHIIDATTGKPYSGDIIATWAIASSTAVADALATGLFFATPARLRRYFGAFKYVIMRANGGVEHNLTPEIGELFV